MIQDKDTVPYQQSWHVSEDTLYLGNNIIYPGDTTFRSPCTTFEKINHQIVNFTDATCTRQGLWIITDTLGNYRTGVYKNGREYGIWKKYDKSGNLLEETERVTVFKDIYTVKEVDYSSGKQVVLIDKPFLKYYLSNLILIMITFFVSFFSRVFINSSIYNSENKTNHSVIYLFAGPYVTDNFAHSLLCIFTFWFANYSPQNRKLALISNTLSVITLGIFFGIIIGLGITGEI